MHFWFKCWFLIWIFIQLKGDSPARDEHLPNETTKIKLTTTGSMLEIAESGMDEAVESISETIERTLNSTDPDDFLDNTQSMIDTEISIGDTAEDIGNKLKIREEMKWFPPKPDFEWSVVPDQKCAAINIKWLPCGIEKTCVLLNDTYFTLRYKLLESKRWLWTDIIKTDTYTMRCVFPGRIFEVIITSIWVIGNLQTDSDAREVFYPPISSPVRSFKVFQLEQENLNAVMSWLRPSHSIQPIYTYAHLQINTNLFDDMTSPTFPEPSHASWGPKAMNQNIEQTLTLFNFETSRNSSWMFISFPVTKEGLYGLEYRILEKDIPQIILTSNIDLPLAKPYIRILTEINGPICNIEIDWLLCGKENDCENTKHGSSFNYQVKNENTAEFVIKKYKDGSIGYRFSNANTTDTYEITVQAVRGNETSEAVTKKFSCGKK